MFLDCIPRRHKGDHANKHKGLKSDSGPRIIDDNVAVQVYIVRDGKADDLKRLTGHIFHLGLKVHWGDGRTGYGQLLNQRLSSSELRNIISQCLFLPPGSSKLSLKGI